MEQQLLQRSFLSRGTRFDLTKFLKYYTGRRCPALVRNDNRKAMTFPRSQKMMMLCFFSLPLPLDAVAIAQAVSLVSSEMNSFGAFELIILVESFMDCANQDAVLSTFISCFPSFCLTSMSKIKLGLGPIMPLACKGYPHGLLVNRAEIVEWHKPLDFLLKYGVDAFPFTSEQLSWISECDKRTLSLNCLSDFLCYRPFTFPSPSTYLHKNPGGDTEKATISDLQDKCVGLYLCLTGNLIPTLDEVHKRCCRLGLEFEIILVYMPFRYYDNPQEFQERINSTLKEQNISWWVFPFIYWVSRRLSRLSHQDAEDRLIIIDPKYKYVEFHGESVISYYCATAYPFSRELLVNREVERLSAVTLESFLESPLYYLDDEVIREYSITRVQGKTVVLYFYCGDAHSHNCFNKLYLYYKLKAGNPNFRIVVVGPVDVHSSLTDFAMLLFSRDTKHTDYVTRTIFEKGDKCCAIITFGKDGCISSLLDLRLVCYSCSDFPLCNNLHNEMSAELAGSKELYGAANKSDLYFMESIKQGIPLVPLLGKEHFFPGIPVCKEMKPPEMHDSYGCAYKCEVDKYLAPKNLFSYPTEEDAQYPKAIYGKVASIDHSNFDVVSFLSDDKRDYLVRNDKHNTSFPVTSLREKKWVMICCLICPIYFDSYLTLIYRGISDVCSELYHKLGDTFEMVLVCKMMRDFEADRSSFEHMLSGFPPSCLVVPFWDPSSRDAICFSLGFKILPEGLVLNVKDKWVIQNNYLVDMEEYGVDLFPFTKEAFHKIRDEERNISWKDQSLETVLCCSPADVLYKNPGGADSYEKISIEQLGKKLVGVYLCLAGDAIPVLDKLYKVCKENNVEFEIVIVYCHSSGRNSNMELFKKHINNALRERDLSWWVLPYKGWVSRRLRRLLLSGGIDDLFILGNGVVPHREDIIPLLKNLEYKKQEQFSSSSDVDEVIAKVILEFMKTRKDVDCSKLYHFQERTERSEAFSAKMIKKATGGRCDLISEI